MGKRLNGSLRECCKKGIGSEGLGKTEGILGTRERRWNWKGPGQTARRQLASVWLSWITWVR